MFYNEKAVNDWKADKYRWRDKGLAIVPKKDPLFLIHYYDVIGTNEPTTFKSRAIILYNKEKQIIMMQKQ